MATLDRHPTYLGFVSTTAPQYAPLKRDRDGIESVFINNPARNPLKFVSPESCSDEA